MIPKPAISPSSIVEPGVTGPYGPVTYVRGTFERPFGGQEIVAGPYAPAGIGSQQQILPGPSPYGPPFGQQVLPGYSQYIPGAQTSFGQQQVLGGGAPIGVAGGYGYPGAASDEGTNSNGAAAANAAGAGVGGDAGAHQANILAEQSTIQPQLTSTGPVFTTQPSIIRPHPQQNEFNSNVRNDDADGGQTTTVFPGTPPVNKTFLGSQQFRALFANNGSQPSLPLRDDHHQKRKSRRAEKSDVKKQEHGTTPTAHSDMRTRPGPVDGDDADGATPPPANAHGDVHLMDVTAEMVYVSDIGDTDVADGKSNR